MNYTYNTPNRKQVLCIIDKIFEKEDSVTIYAKEHPENKSFTITNSVEYLIASFEEKHPNKKIYICYDDSFGEMTMAKMIDGKPVFY
jgi:hypothetical protein